MSETKDLKPAECFGEIVISLKFRTGAVGDTPPWQLVPILFDKFLTSLEKSKDLGMWEAVIDDVRYEPFKETCGGKAFSCKVDNPLVKIGKA